MYGVEDPDVFNSIDALAPPAAPGAANDLSRAAYQQMFANTPLGGQYDRVIAAAAKNGISAAMMAAIMAHESGRGTSRFVTSLNNPGGLMDPKSPNSTRGLSFPDIGAGIDATGRTIARNFNLGGRTISGMAKSYAPQGAINDPRSLNRGWVPGVNQYIRMLSVPGPSGAPTGGDTGAQFSSDIGTQGDFYGDFFDTSSTGGFGAGDEYSGLSGGYSDTAEPAEVGGGGGTPGGGQGSGPGGGQGSGVSHGGDSGKGGVDKGGPAVVEPEPVQIGPLEIITDPTQTPTPGFDPSAYGYGMGVTTDPSQVPDPNDPTTAFASAFDTFFDVGADPGPYGVGDLGDPGADLGDLGAPSDPGGIDLGDLGDPGADLGDLGDPGADLGDFGDLGDPGGADLGDLGDPGGADLGDLGDLGDSGGDPGDPGGDPGDPGGDEGDPGGGEGDGEGDGGGDGGDGDDDE
jgi:hypothetical protein